MAMMMRVSVKLFAVLLGIFLTTTQCLDMSDLFTLDYSCDGYNLNQYLTDAISLVSTSQTATNTLIGVRDFSTASESVYHYMRNAANVFGTQYYAPDTTTGLSSADKARLSFAQGTLRLVLIMNGLTD